jgi:hypothetical protein
VCSHRQGLCLTRPAARSASNMGFIRQLPEDDHEIYRRATGAQWLLVTCFATATRARFGGSRRTRR